MAMVSMLVEHVELHFAGELGGCAIGVDWVVASEERVLLEGCEAVGARALLLLSANGA